MLRLLARGYTYREMAERLFISVKTVETHVSNILRKTQQSNRHALTRWVGIADPASGVKADARAAPGNRADQSADRCAFPRKYRATP